MEKLTFNSARKFGIELEYLAKDRRNFKQNPLNKGEVPKGIEDVGALLTDDLKATVSIQKWGLTHNNNQWILKPDSSCGIEVCSPVLKGNNGIYIVDQCVRSIIKDKDIVADEKCGLHVHAAVDDLGQEELMKVIQYWIKCEKVFLDSVPDSRKRNRYCQMIGINPMFECESNITWQKMLDLLGNNKYYTMNTYHLQKGNRNTMEWRIAEGAGCMNPVIARNWVRLILHFVERCKTAKSITKFKSGDQWSGLCWLDPNDVFEFLGFNGTLADDLRETKDWFLARLNENHVNKINTGIWHERVQKVSNDNIAKMVETAGLSKNYILELLNSDIPMKTFKTEEIEKPDRVKKREIIETIKKLVKDEDEEVQEVDYDDE